jgi:hypothetical protein
MYQVMSNSLSRIREWSRYSMDALVFTSLFTILPGWGAPGRVSG